MSVLGLRFNEMLNAKMQASPHITCNFAVSKKKAQFSAGMQ